MQETPFGKIPDHWIISDILSESNVVTDFVANGSFASLAENVQYKAEEDFAVLIRLVDFNNQFKDNFVFIDEHAYNFLCKSQLFGGEIIISNVGANVGTVFKCPHLKYKMALAPNSIMVKFNGDNDFYYYWLSSPAGQGMLQSIVTGSAQPKFNKTNFRSMAIPVPPLSEQKKIAAILSSLDDKIETNRKINARLEELAQALFKSWFIDFEPFGGKMPKEWEECNLGDILIVKYGKDHKNLGDGQVPVYGSGGIMRYADKSLYDKESVLIPRKGSLNNLFYVDTPFWSVDTMFFTEMKKSDIAKYIFLYLKQLDFISMNCGSAIPSMTTNILNSLKITLPPDDILTEFEKVIKPVFLKIKQSFAESSRLTELRDTLLPKLMSGEIKLS